MLMDWESDDSHLLLNPSYPLGAQDRFKTLMLATSHLKGHLWLSTSGSTVAKWVGLSKEAILASAQAVNIHLQSDKSDRWALILPSFHVGGLGVRARAHLNGAAVYDFKEFYKERWNPALFCQFVQQTKSTLSALVPTQLYDLVQNRYQAPPSLRAVVIGGGALPTGLYREAVALKWPVLPSYGMTECASQVATAPLGSWQKEGDSPLQILTHMRVRTLEEGRLSFLGSSLLTAYAYFKEGEWLLEDPKKQGWFNSEDRGVLQESFLFIEGRMDHIIKIGGERVDLGRLEGLLEQTKRELALTCDACLVAYPDPRLGMAIHLVLTPCSSQEADLLVEGFHRKVLPFEKIRLVHKVSSIPRSPLAKVLRGELLTRIQSRLQAEALQ